LLGHHLCSGEVQICLQTMLDYVIASREDGMAWSPGIVALSLDGIRSQHP
jgi:hypothetical protein